MIVRILGEGQFDVPEGELARLNQLDAEVERSVTAEDESAFRTALAALLDAVRGIGAPLDEDVLEDSEYILPHGDATLDEVRQLLRGDGLIPG